MKKDLEWLKEEIGELPCVDTVFNSDGSSYIDSAVPVMAVFDLIDKLDEPEVTLNRAFEKVSEIYPMTKGEVCRHLERVVAHGGKVTYGEQEVLSQEWIDEHAVAVTYGGMKDKKWLKEKVETCFSNWWSEPDDGVRDLMGNVKHLINQLDEPEVLSLEWVDDNSVYASSDGITEEYVHVDDLKELLVPKQELPVIPSYMAEYLELAKSDVSLMRVLEIANRRDELPKWEKEYDWISTNDEVFARAWLDGYTVEEEPLYYALIKGHELIKYKGFWTDGYWNFNPSTGCVFHSNRFTVGGKYLIKMSKSEWHKIGINDSNADFVKVEEEV